MNAPRDANWDDHMAAAMKDPVEAAAYLDAVLEMDDPAALLVALRQNGESKKPSREDRAFCLILW